MNLSVPPPLPDTYLSVRVYVLFGITAIATAAVLAAPVALNQQ